MNEQNISKPDFTHTGDTIGLDGPNPNIVTNRMVDEAAKEMGIDLPSLRRISDAILFEGDNTPPPLRTKALGDIAVSDHFGDEVSSNLPPVVDAFHPTNEQQAVERIDLLTRN